MLRSSNRMAALAAQCLSVVALLAFFLTGAAIARSVMPPRVEVGTLTPMSVGSSSHSYRVSLLFDNENTEPLAIGEIKFTIRVLGQGVVTGRSAGVLTIEALDRTTLQVDVDGEAMPSFSQLRAAAAPGDKLDYELFGNVTLAKGGKKRLPIQARGVLTLLAPASN
jgi:LEA14-like dessication related protein